MKFEPEIARNILLDIEEIHEYPKPLFLYSFEKFARCSGVEKNVILYHLSKLEEADFIIWQTTFADNDFYCGTLSGLTYEGHQFLDSVRSPKIWRETKSKAGKLGIFTLDVVSQIATSLISEQLNNYLK